MESVRVMRRRYEDDLNVSGMGVIVLGLWSVVRAIAEIYGYLKELTLQETENEAAKYLGIVIAAIIAAILLILILTMHLYVGLNAMKAARRQPHKKGYCIAAVFMMVLLILSLFSYYDRFEDLANIDTTLVSILVDLTTVYTFACIVRSAHKIKLLNEKQMQE